LLEFGFYLPTRIHFGQNKIKQVGKVAKLYGKKALVVTGKSSARKLGFLQIIENKLKQEKIKSLFFEQVEPNPSVDTINKGASFFNKGACDMIIALGGGSPLDAAKAIGILAKNSLPVSCYFGKNKVENNIPPLIAIPTTSGAGSEVTPYTVITDNQDINHPKKIIADWHLFPKEALIDPTLTLSLPSRLTTDTGIDALSHAIESYLSKKSFFLSEAIALKAIKIIGKYLPQAINHPKDIETRGYLSYAATLAGLTISLTGATLLHAMGYPLTSDLGISHGRANGILLPWFWEYSFSGNPEKFSKIITHLVKNARENQLKNAQESAFLLKEFLHQSGLPAKLEIETNEKSLSQFAQRIAKNKEKIAVSPKELDFEKILTIYKKSLLTK